MSLTLASIRNQVDYLVDTESGLAIYIYDYDDEDGFDLEYDDGTPYKILPEETPVESFVDGTISIDGRNYRAYVAQIVTFEPTKETD